ncbi:ArsO family NAD(P)H-dependent flavin-containing monooxygenase [Lapillicoccus jejuensis]|uniref:Putative flavoprotein involved in K+ transport n=1 Tax=Lapillicoccus jejuensis TaxID=402171 RepID=A0A542E124_9MICO|nr:ArsO family NAD(P)H-dependent flavin-containing monooxygenase [Lapillicoccus jejuensis]TQJ09036.1 putative flavoprotein involved in K+ transport [Lapillicoccus jejuensis]
MTTARPTLWDGPSPVGAVDEGSWPVVVVGAGQAGLATAYHLRRAGLELGRDVVLLDADDRPGGSWRRMWPSLRLFSPPAFSSLPGRPMPPADDPYPGAAHVAAYLQDHEQRYGVVVRRGVRVTGVARDGDALAVTGLDAGAGVERRWRARHVVSATGTWTRPFVPAVPGRDVFAGRQLHSASYRGVEDVAGARVLVVGGGNSGAQLMAEVSAVARATWVTLRPPRFLPDDVDGRRLFEVATARRRALLAGEADPGGVGGLGDVVAVASVREARDAGRLRTAPMVAALTPTGAVWPDGTTDELDVVLWCTGFRPELRHLRPLRLPTVDGHPRTDGTTCVDEPRLHLVGYGDWTGPASATLVGVGPTAKETAARVVADLRRLDSPLT